MSKFYAVKMGRKTGVFSTWEECKKQVDGFPNAVYKSFTSYEDAKLFVFDKKLGNQKTFDFKAEITAYIDGSYNDDQKYYSFASIIFDGDKKLKFAGADNDLAIVEQRNVAGEVKAAIQVIEYAVRRNAKSIEIFYDYAGIEKWAKNEWKAKNSFTKSYVEFIQKVSSQIEIVFLKVKSHSGNTYNDEVDLLAKAALKPPYNKIEEVYNLSNNQNTSENYSSSSLTFDYEKGFEELKGNKKNLNLGLMIENKIFSSEHILKVFKSKWKKQKRKLNEYTEIKAVFDIENQVIIIRVLNTQGKYELVKLDKGDMVSNG
ncbi:viroplasmin family protein [Saccharibacillus brassicae]|uniref:ribonuclease H n=1 Tax=Saccharibacillus brassicae TaxID=2583377 RepID=A0A4Y6UVJ2_SACBS|nr:ribonuclease H family protein [Saccharibacillus brassicae]QDH20267.1 hypothetical protein FFV09_04965 [Saccharibacillus brassicae]